MARGIRRKCKHCLKLFRPDPRNHHHQRYCSAPACRAASKAASQARWLAVPENQNYFHDPVHVARVKAWRSRHPGYWRKGRSARTALQEVLIAHIVGTPLQDDIARTTERLLRLGRDILALTQSPDRDQLRDVL